MSVVPDHSAVAELPRPELDWLRVIVFVVIVVIVVVVAQGCEGK